MSTMLKRVIVLLLVVVLAGGVIAVADFGPSAADTMLKAPVGAGSLVTPGAITYDATSTSISVKNPQSDCHYAIYNWDDTAKEYKALGQWVSGINTDISKKLNFTNLGLKPDSNYYLMYMLSADYSDMVSGNKTYKDYGSDKLKIATVLTAIDPLITRAETNNTSAAVPGHTSITITNADNGYKYWAFDSLTAAKEKSSALPSFNATSNTYTATLTGLEAGKTYYIAASRVGNERSDRRAVATGSHTYTYTVTEANRKIVASCSANDGASYSVEVTATAYTKAYDGTSIAPNSLFTVYPAQVSVYEEIAKNLKYTLKAGGETTLENSGAAINGASPVYPGEYIATLTLGGNSLTKSIQITGNGPTVDAPTGLTGVAPTTATAKDGKITGLKSTETYQYSTDYGLNWYYRTGATEITGLGSGVVLVRTYNASTGFSKIAAVTVGTATTTNATTPGTGGSLPVSGNSSQNIAATIKNGNATISAISGAEYNTLFKTEEGKDTQEIIIDASGTTLGVTNITLATSVLTDINKGLAEPSNNKDFLVLKTKDMNISFDTVAVSSILSAAKGTDINFFASAIEEKDINTNQKSEVSAIKGTSGQSVEALFRLEVKSNNTAITTFGNGNVTVEKTGYRVSIGKDLRKYHVYYLPATGKTERQSSWVINNNLCFNTNHFSDYAVVYDTGRNNEELLPVYRFYNPGNGDHLFTIDTYEANVVKRAGWADEGIPFYVFSSGTGTPVYRLYNENTGEHLYTMDSSERGLLIRSGWTYEGNNFISNGRQNVYRLYNPNQISNNHHYTTSKAELNSLKKAGWKEGDLAFNVQ